MEVNIGKAIAKGLKKQGWANKKLAEVLGVSPPTVSNWLSDTRKPTADMLIRVAVTLDIVDELFPVAERKQVKKDQIHRKLAAIKNLIADIEQQLDKVS